MLPPEGGYTILWTPRARRHLDQLPEKIVAAALALIHGPLAEEPRRVGKPLVDELAGLWSARRAAYRIVYEIAEAGDAVWIHAVQHRRDVHRPHRRPARLTASPAPRRAR